MNLKLAIVLLVIFYFPSQQLQNLAWGQQVTFSHLTIDDGLVSSNIRGFLEDYQGFIWIATEDGLQRYDGQELVTYRHIPNDTTSLGSSFITWLYEDTYHNFWIATLDGGLTLYNRSENNFRNFKHKPNDQNSPRGDRVRTFFETQDKKLFIGFEEGGVDYFQLKEDMTSISELKTHKIQLPEPTKNAETWVQSIVGTKDNYIFIGSNGNGLSAYNLLTKESKPVLRDTIDNQIHNLFLDSNDRLWIGTWGNGLFIYDLNTKMLINHRASKYESTLNDDHIDACIEDDEHNIWIGTDNGLSLVSNQNDPFEKNIFTNYLHSDLASNSLLGNIIKGIYKDKSDRIWVGSYYGGVNVYDKNSKIFQPISARSWKKGSINHNNVFAFAEDSRGNLWIGTDGGGIDWLKGGVKELYNNNFQHIEIIGPLTGKAEEKVKCMAIDEYDNLYIGYWRGGLIKFNTQDFTYTQYISQEIPENGPSINMILDIDIDKENNLWLATFNGGLNYFNQKTGKFKHYSQITSSEDARDLDKILSICIDSKDRVWASRSTGGLNLYDAIKDNFSTIDFGIIRKNETINDIFEDNEGSLWLGTSNQGLKMYHPDRKTTKHYTTQDGLPSNRIFSILQDDKGDLWIATTNGVSNFKPQTEEFINYFNFDGLQSNEFNHNSAYKNSHGTLFFGGVNGFNAINPDEINPSFSKPRIVLTKFWLDNRESPINDPESPLDENISLTNTIELGNQQNSFSIGFSALNFSFSNKSEFAYKLQGFDEEWKYIGHDNKAIFTNLDPGTYHLHLKASNRTGYWSPEYEMLEISIKKAFWQLRIFQFGVFVLIVIVVYLIYRYRVNLLIKQRKNLLEMVKERTSELTLKNQELLKQREEISMMNKEILAQNEELTAQNDQIFSQQEALVSAQKELKKVNANLEKMVADRTQKLESTINSLDKMVLDLDRFVYSASHELSAPLKSIAGIVNITKIEKDNSRIQEYLHHIELSVQKTEAVIKSILSYSRNTHLDLEEETIPLKPVVDEIIQELKPYSSAGKIEFINNVDEKLVLNVDKQRLKIVLQNILSNSIKYADFEKPDPQVVIECIRQKGKTIIRISDNGIGIKKERIDKIFNMYYRGTTKSQGSGLGLFIVKEMIQRMKGQITVKSKSEKGTTFEIAF